MDFGVGRVGAMIGRYKLREKIGEGGFGVVFLAEQIEPVQRKVALKIIKAGMDTREVIARFEAERQALALMDHPNIAKVLDAGTTDTGRPYFVMELVRGIKLTDYCDQNSLSTQERLRLFIEVCHAVQHAHQKGIIHRDIKPSNILVTITNGAPVPKVIDFGIAKATAGQKLTDKTLFTAFEQFMGTPAYMSPEQAEMSGLDIDTRSDIYSLGVLLYELLTGKTPFDSKRLIAAGLDEIRRIIREEEPPRPSTRLGALVAEEQTTTAKRRQTDPPRLIHLVRGDLDWIVMKALDKDRIRRYETANGLASDIERHLKDEPVEAHAPSQLYRLQKLLRRHKLAFAAAAVMFVALATGLGVSLWSLHKANREASRSAQVARFLREMLQSVGPSAALGRDTKLLREVLDKTAQRLDEELKDQPDVEADLRTTIGQVYFDLGQYTNAEAMHRQALMLRREVFGSEHTATANSLNNLANALSYEGRYQEAEKLHRQVLEMKRKLLGREHPDIPIFLHNLALDIKDQTRLPEAEALFREALALQKKLPGGESPLMANYLNNLGMVLDQQGKLSEAEALYREALAVERKLLGSEHPHVALSLKCLAAALRQQGKLAEAETMTREALALQTKVLGSEHPDLPGSMQVLAGVLQVEGKLSEAVELDRKALAMQKKQLGSDHPFVAGSMRSLAMVLNEQGEMAEAAESLFAGSLAIYRRQFGDENLDVADALNCLGLDLQDEGKFSAAEALHREALAIQKKLAGAEDSRVTGSLDFLAQALAGLRKFEEAEALQREALAMAKKLLGSEHVYSADILNHLARTLQQEDKLPEAEILFREALAVRKKLLDSEHPDVTESLGDLARVLLLQERFIEAEALARECLAIREKRPSRDWETFEARSLLGGSLVGEKKYAEAEPLLLAGYKGMKERAEKIPARDKRRLNDVLRYLVRLYHATGKPEEAAKWERELTARGP
jgi:serine/threonine protein kinase